MYGSIPSELGPLVRRGQKEDWKVATVFGETSDVTQSAVFGRNDSTSAPSGGGVQGAGVFGLTVSPGAAGVFGANNSAKGVGVQGNGPEAGLSGFSDQGAGVTAHSNHANAIQGFAVDFHQNGQIACKAFAP
jgi:hypothetical protein